MVPLQCWVITNLISILVCEFPEAKNYQSSKIIVHKNPTTTTTIPHDHPLPTPPITTPPSPHQCSLPASRGRSWATPAAGRGSMPAAKAAAASRKAAAAFARRGRAWAQATQLRPSRGEDAPGAGKGGARRSLPCAARRQTV